GEGCCAPIAKPIANELVSSSATKATAPTALSATAGFQVVDDSFSSGSQFRVLTFRNTRNGNYTLAQTVEIDLHTDRLTRPAWPLRWLLTCCGVGTAAATANTRVTDTLARDCSPPSTYAAVFIALRQKRT